MRGKERPEPGQLGGEPVGIGIETLLVARHEPHAPSLGKPVLVMRESTERPEGIAAGTARLVGTSPTDIIDAVETLLRDPNAYQAMAKAINPYGDGYAARRTVEALNFFLELGPAPSDFEASEGSSESDVADGSSGRLPLAS